MGVPSGPSRISDGDGRTARDVRFADRSEAFQDRGAHASVATHVISMQTDLS
jgi:hypothetical protein